MIGTIRLNLRTDKVRKSGQSPIELIYSVEGQRKYLNTGINLSPENWDASQQKAIYFKSRDIMYPLKEGVEDINRELRRIGDAIVDVEKRILLDGEQISSALVIERFKEGQSPLTKKDEPAKFVFDFIDRHIAENQHSKEPGTLTTYRSLKRHLEDYQKETKTKVAFSNINYSFFQSFQSFLFNKKVKVGDGYRHLQNSTIAKQISTLKTLLGYARKHGIAISDSYRDFTVKRDKLDVIALTESEFMSLYNLDLTEDKSIDFEHQFKGNRVSYRTLAKVRGIFCFSCVTGLRYSDLMAIRWENVKGDEIRFTVTKTKKTLTIPLNAYAVEILERYQGYYKPLPNLSSQNFNIYIKELCKLAGIDEPVQITRYNGTTRVDEVYPKHELITAHVGRKTFCTLSLEKGMSAEQVMKISGHTDYKSFQRYVNVTENIKRRAMHSAWGAPANSLHLKKVSGG